jgi:tetratricopeptide (TPR) repeat protein
MGRQRVPNYHLRSLLDETGWSGQKFVSAINHLGAEVGLTLTYQRASVTQWLSGIRPRSPVPELMAEAFSRELGRHVTTSDLGLRPVIPAPRTPEQFTWQEGSAATALRGACATGHDGWPYQTAALAVPAWPGMPTSHADQVAPDATSTRPGRPEVRSAAAMVRMFSDADMMFGGGHARLALAGYLRSTVVPWLAGDTHPTVRRKLLIVAARLSYLCGFMCFDDELHGRAQRHYLTSLRLSAESADAISYALTLRALSVQARILGHCRPAVDLAEAAVRTATSRATPRVHAFLLGQLAVAHAADGNGHDAIAALAAAEKHLSHADGYTPGVAAYHASSLAHQQAATTACLGDRRNAIKALETSIRHRPAEERRSRAITLARLAELQLAEGHLEQACHTWRRFLDDYPHLASRRADTAMKTLRASTRPHQNQPAVRALLHRATALAS